MREIAESQTEPGAWTLCCDALWAEIVPSAGMMIRQLVWRDHPVVMFDPERCEKGMLTAIPVLYPTPNRVRNQCAAFGEIAFGATMHGFARRSVFTVTGHGAEASGVWLEAALQVTPDADNGPFPWAHTLTLRVTLTPGAFHWSYRVENHSGGTLPFGIALHPFFRKGSGATLTVRAASVMEMTGDKLPTGLLKPAGDAGPALLQHPAGSWEFDHVFTDLEPGSPATVSWEDMSMDMTSSGDFTHLVVYTPPESPFFCIENQTCATDAHNLFSRGYEKVSGLECVPPGAQTEGWVRWTFRSPGMRGET